MKKHIMIQIDKVLPSSAWRTVAIYENGEPLVKLKETSKLKLGIVQKPYSALFMVRISVAEKLYRAANRLPDGIVLVIIEGYRTTEHQQEEWDRVAKEIKSHHKGFSDDQIEQMTGMLVARPLPLANHHCGGAVDATLAHDDGTLVDMGTPYISQIKDIGEKKKIPMLSSCISQEQEDNRKLLRNVLGKEDFVWYPGEWWHYCFGDRMWAVYTGKTMCMYGSIEL